MAGAGLVAGGGFTAARGIFSAITEIIDEAGDLLEAVVNNLKEVVLYDAVIVEERAYPPNARRAKLVKKTITRHVRITAWDIVLGYAILRILGMIPPIWDLQSETNRPVWDTFKNIIFPQLDPNVAKGVFEQALHYLGHDTVFRGLIP